MELERLAKRVRDAFGLQHQANLLTLRAYLKRTDDDKLIKQIRDIKDAAYLRTLWEAGLRARVQAEVMKQLEKIS